ncbi:DUF1345 domain-containing protein [Methylobacterium gnaphalii]|uniref:Membrane protein n=1 Tax=Methylobacterium gnaphalii TaxID=1010610 RepID=A0A512JI37_9HYPH|nr:DUF1345 domain-containing protein [Methylobacterium gnaphalii]GEP09620.1 membrane protein [Methylobacterium gnaphalii]GJD67792.1 hypothetical protein MMMDOFMJ_0709 [Methylobacterium gnaphalii]GLS48587.1 membrane protein [Methylobacterium gnaphalii]
MSVNPFRAFWMRPRLLGAILVALVLTAALPFASIWTRLLLGWCAAVVVYTTMVTWNAADGTPDALRREASRLDDSAPVISLFAILAAAASIGSVAMLVFGQQEHDGYKAAHLALAAATMVCTWVFVQIVFTIHYAHVYYGSDEKGGSRGGLDFNGDANPDFWDFLYFSVTIGATSQTSDTDITSKRMRRIATVQTIYAYFFNTSILALAINMAAGFVQH